MRSKTQLKAPKLKAACTTSMRVQPVVLCIVRHVGAPLQQKALSGGFGNLKSFEHILLMKEFESDGQTLFGREGNILHHPTCICI